jgi:1-deoxy-D-xylulose-5-phosphate reductoisomerase
VIEAFWLFNMDIARIEVLIHPQSIIHSMVCYKDGSLLAQLGSPDMRTPIAYTLAWPERIRAYVKKLDLIAIGQLTFEAVDNVRFPCLKLAYAAIQAGGTASTLLNAANEVAVSAFLQRKIRFSDIASVIEAVLSHVPVVPATCYETVLDADSRARLQANQVIKRYG